MTRRGGRLVYSTDDARRGEIDRGGRTGGGKPSGPSLPPEKQLAGIRREKKGRGGKTVTLVHDLQLTEADLKALAKQLKAACGTGGSAKDGEIVIQGDHREAIAAALQGLGYKTKFTGG
ncbi:MAG: translation initiation factor [Caldilineae bacterium]|nr:translation initiation factor [Chloroflexota bacterium]MCB9177758.1 translation initiation factor [Caldilineae bacterium]